MPGLGDGYATGGSADWYDDSLKSATEVAADLSFFERNPIFDRQETIVTDPITGGQKGQKDVRLHAIPWESLSELGRVYAFGENKYADYNFRKGYKWSLSYDACLRHLGQFWNREETDSDSGLSHLAHAAWHALTLLFYQLTGRGTDDRPV